MRTIAESCLEELKDAQRSRQEVSRAIIGSSVCPQLLQASVHARVCRPKLSISGKGHDGASGLAARAGISRTRTWGWDDYEGSAQTHASGCGSGGDRTEHR